MSFDQTKCSDAHVQRFLEDQLAGDEEAAFEKHLEVCAECRQRLGRSAAEESWWQEASSLLGDDAIDIELESAGTDATGRLGPSTESGAADAHRLPRGTVDFLDPSDDPRMLGRFGGYEIVGVVGFGGMGVVLKGFDAPLNRYVAIKVLAPHLATSGAGRRRFAREAQAAAAVVHDNVIAIHSVSESGGLPFLVMPYVRGASLQKRIVNQGPLGLVEILRIAKQIASGLAAAHAQGLVHRDIKPANILLEDGVERVTITDFGLARAVDDASLTRTGVLAGTPQFMSPEQVRGEAVDHRSDLFSLGSVLYAMCTGRPPFRAETTFGVLRRVGETTPRPIREISPEIPDWLCEIVDGLHGKDPDQRSQTAAEVAELIGGWLAHVQQPTVVPAPPRPTVAGRRSLQGASVTRRRLLVAACVCAVCLLGAFGLWMSWGPSRSEPLNSGEAGGPVASDPSEKGTSTDVEAPKTGSLSDETSWQHQLRSLHDEAAAIRQQWEASTLPETTDSWEASVSELNQRLEDLSRRIEQNAP